MTEWVITKEWGDPVNHLNVTDPRGEMQFFLALDDESGCTTLSMYVNDGGPFAEDRNPDDEDQIHICDLNDFIQKLGSLAAFRDAYKAGEVKVGNCEHLAWASWPLEGREQCQACGLKRGNWPLQGASGNTKP